MVYILVDMNSLKLSRFVVITLCIAVIILLIERMELLRDIEYYVVENVLLTSKVFHLTEETNGRARQCGTEANVGSDDNDKRSAIKDCDVARTSVEADRFQ
jgi:hypothetical protein